MSDITKCQDDKCPSKEICYRYTAPAVERQDYGIFNREEDANNCDMFWGEKQENIFNQLKEIMNGN
jgi:hypothetical protein